MDEPDNQKVELPFGFKQLFAWIILLILSGFFIYGLIQIF